MIENEFNLPSIPEILEEMQRVVKKNHKVVFTGNFEHPLTTVSDDFVILEIFDITDRLNIYVEDKSLFGLDPFIIQKAA